MSNITIDIGPNICIALVICLVLLVFRFLHSGSDGGHD